MAIKNFDELIQKVHSGKRKTVAIAAADDAHSLEAAIKAKDIVDAILVGSEEKIIAKLKELGESPDLYPIVPVAEDEHPGIRAAKLIHEGKADFIMKGNIMTGTLLKGLLSPEADLRTGSLMSHIMLLQLPGYHKLLAITDGGMCTYPNFDQKKQIVENAVRFFHNLGYEKPTIAALCAMETVNPKMQETVDAAELKRMSLAGELPNCYVEGPISYDLAMVPEISQIKGYQSPCVGDFDILLVPEIVVGNALGKCMVYTCGAAMAGIVIGCKVPLVVASRGSSALEKYYSLALAASLDK